MTPDELRALAGKLRKLQAGEAYEAADYLRACAEAGPVAWRCEVRGDGSDPKLGAVDWRHYHTTTSEREAQAFVSRCDNGIEGRVVPLYAHPAPAAPQAEPIDPHMIVAEDRFPDVPAEPKREPLSELPPLPEPGAYAYEWRLESGAVHRSFSARHYNGVPCDDQVLFFTADQMRDYARAVERAAYERAAQECELQITGSDYHFLATHGHWDHMAQAATNCAAAIRALGGQR